MYRLIYVSSAVRDHTATLTDGFLSAAQARNHASGITGLLAHNGRNFLQVIEGPREDVAGLFKDILEDPRHEHVTVLLEEDVETRAFPDWAMQPLDLSADILDRRAQLGQLLPDDLPGRVRSLILSITTFG